jgi:hypothetical protein
MMINIEAVYQDSMKVAPQYANMWDFSIVDDWTENSGISTFKVESTSLPFPSLTVEKRVTGHHYYSGYELPESFSVTFREDKNFSVYTYFKNWQKQVFDLKTGTFISGANVPHKKTGTIRFTAFENGEEVPTKIFTLHGLRFLGFEDVSLNYTEGNQLTITVNFAMDLATDES